MAGLIAIGHISKSVGLRGEMKVIPLTDNPDRFHALSSVWIGQDETSAREFGITNCRVTSKGVFVQIDSVDDKDGAEKFRGSFVFIPEDQAVQLPRGSHFIHEIIGLTVETEEGEEVGTVTDVQKYPAQDIWIVRKGSREFMIPAVPEIVRQVDLKQKRITIRPIEGLLDSN